MSRRTNRTARPSLAERLEDRRLMAATLVSVDASGLDAPGNDVSGGTKGFGVTPPSVSASGRYVAFVSDAGNLAEGDENGLTDVFVRDTETGGTTLATLNSAFSNAGNAASGVTAAGDAGPRISTDGRYVVFASAASDLVSNDTNDAPDVFLHDVDMASTFLISVNGAGAGPGNGAVTGQPVISADGRFVAFTSTSSDLVAGVADGDGATADVFVRDLNANRTEQVSRPTSGNGGGAADGAAGSPSISDDGRYVAFLSAATNLGAVTGVASGDQVYVRDTTADSTTLASPNAAGTGFSNGDASNVALSGDGRSVAFISTGTNLLSGVTDGNDATASKGDVLVRDLNANVTRGASVNAAGTATGNGGATQLAISADGNAVAFASTASDLAAGVTDANAASDVFVRDVDAGVTTLVSVAAVGGATGGGASGAEAGGLSISADGRAVAFTSAAGNLVATGAASGGVFVRDRQAAQTRLAAANPAGGAAGASSAVLSADGQRVFFTSDAADVVAGDANNVTDLFFAEVGGERPAADLTAAVTSNLPAAVIVGGRSRATTLVNVANSGTTPLSQPITVRFVLSTDEFVDASDFAVGTVTRTLKLRPGTGKVLRAKIRSLPEVAGTYRLLAQVDPENTLAEADEGDNTAVGERFVTVAAPFADLGVTVAGAPQTLARGRRGSVTVELRSAGNVPASGPVTFALALAPATPGANVPVTTVTKRYRLAGGARKNVKLNFAVPADVVAGTYSFAVAIQPDASVADADPSNNGDASNLTAVIS